jgi:hypothetical protein
MADLISWLYSGTMISKNKTDMMELYVIADEKMMQALRRSIMTRYLSLDDAGYINLNSDETVSLLHRLPSNSGLFRYFVDYWTYSWIQISVSCDLERWDRDGRIPRAFFYQALKRCVKGAVCESGSPDSTYACNYHEHINGDKWESSKSFCSHTLTYTYKLGCGDVQENTFIPNVQRPSHAYYNR